MVLTVAFGDVLVLTEHHGANRVALEVQREAEGVAGNSSISPCITSARPCTRQIPSVTETTVPWVRTSLPTSRFAILALNQFADFRRIQIHCSYSSTEVCSFGGYAFDLGDIC